MIVVDDRPWKGEWADDDPDANFKREVVESTRADPVPTLEQLSASTGVPVRALARYALVKWAAEGSETLLALGPRTVQRLWAAVEAAEAEGTAAARLEAYETLRALLSWLRAPLVPDEP
jgi:hypothetical protein